MALEAPVGFGFDGEVEELPISRLRVGEGVRTGGLDQEHVELLMESVDSWPPIVVWGPDLVVVDGSHRVEAARRLGRYSVIATRFLGSPEEAFIEAAGIRRELGPLPEQIYVAVDGDVLDPAAADVHYPEPGGLDQDELELLLAGLPRPAGAGFTGFVPSARNEVLVPRLARALGF